MGLSDEALAEARATITRALDEDLRYGPDVTTMATVPADTITKAAMVTREPGVAAGVDLALLVLDEVLGADGYRVTGRVEDGARLDAGDALLTVEADTRGLLTAERTMLNLVCHLSGIATETARWVAAVEGTHAKIRDTRKTLPGLRALQKYAVRVGGGVNHRMGLGDAALIKDNHVAAAGGVVEALRAVRAAAPDLPCEVEVDSLEELDEVLAEGRRTRSAGQLSGVADADRRAAPRCAGRRQRCWSPRAACRSKRPPSTRAPVSTSLRSARSPIRCASSTSAWTSRRAESVCHARLGSAHVVERNARQPSFR